MRLCLHLNQNLYFAFSYEVAVSKQNKLLARVRDTSQNHKLIYIFIFFKKFKKYLLGTKYKDNMRIMHQNVDLINEINELKREKKILHDIKLSNNNKIQKLKEIEVLKAEDG